MRKRLGAAIEPTSAFDLQAWIDARLSGGSALNSRRARGAHGWGGAQAVASLVNYMLRDLGYG
jgi:hypothetical protein